jgi:hypothetical protein
MAESATRITVYHPTLSAKREVDASLKDRYKAAGWMLSEPKTATSPAPAKKAAAPRKRAAKKAAPAAQAPDAPASE